MVQNNAVSWFEIPAIDLRRAQTFYESILEIKMIPMDLENLKMRIFPTANTMGVGGSLCYSGGFHKPSATEGPLIYLNANPDVQKVLDRGREGRRQNSRSKNRNFRPIWLHGGDP